MVKRMVRIVIRCWILVAVALLLPLVCGSLLLGQQPAAKGDKAAPKAKPAQPQAKDKPASAKPEKAAVPSLKELLTQALKENPDIRVAETKLREAEADLNRTRLSVTRKVVALHQALKSQQAQIETAEASYKYAQSALKGTKEQFDTGRVTQPVLDEKQASLETAKAALVAAKAALAQTEAELPYLLGQYPQTSTADPKAEQARLLYLQTMYQARKQFNEWANSESLKKRQPTSQPLPGAMADKIRKALNTPVKCEVETASLSEVLGYLGDKTQVQFITKDRRLDSAEVRIPLKGAVPLAAALQAIRDLFPDIRFAVRDYGILVTTNDDLPPGAVLVDQFWKAEQAKEKPAATPPKK